MSTSALVVTDEQAFAEAWKASLGEAGLSVRTTSPATLSQSLTDARAVVIDASAKMFDEDELLASVGLARALGAVTAVALPSGGSLGGIEDVMEDLCPGLIAREQRDVSRISAALGRRVDDGRHRRFEYLTVSPRADALLAILGDGTTALLPRPVSGEDDGSEVASIQLGDDATSATLTLSSGAQLQVNAAAVSHGNKSGAPPANGHASIDGAKLGARLRELRLAAGLTQAELARRTGIHRPNIARVEAGRHTPSLETLARLAAAIGVPTTHVLQQG
jgi:DNA-binding XRE family transcriptional regulator